MTHTPNLNLCTWTLDDEVSLDEINQNFQTLDLVLRFISALNYTGSGTCGSSAAREISFSFAPRLILIFGGGRQCVLLPTNPSGASTGADGTQILTVQTSGLGKTVCWYGDTAAAQMNEKDVTYLLVSIG